MFQEALQTKALPEAAPQLYLRGEGRGHRRGGGEGALLPQVPRALLHQALPHPVCLFRGGQYSKGGLLKSSRYSQIITSLLIELGI